MVIMQLLNIVILIVGFYSKNVKLIIKKIFYFFVSLWEDFGQKGLTLMLIAILKYVYLTSK